jgi:hypothetical protein
VLEPGVTCWPDGVALKVKLDSAGAFTTSVADVPLPVTPGEAPLMFIVEGPTGVLVPVDTVNTDDAAEDGIGLGAKVPIAPEGKPVTLRLTSPENPPVRVTFTV